MCPLNCNSDVSRRNLNANLRNYILFNILNFFFSIEYTSDSKLLELNQIVSVKYSVDGYFYRARIIKKTDENNYDVVFIDSGWENNVNVTDIVPLPIQLQQVKLNYK